MAVYTLTTDDFLPLEGGRGQASHGLAVSMRTAMLLFCENDERKTDRRISYDSVDRHKCRQRKLEERVILKVLSTLFDQNEICIFRSMAKMWRSSIWWLAASSYQICSSKMWLQHYLGTSWPFAARNLIFTCSRESFRSLRNPSTENSPVDPNFWQTRSCTHNSSSTLSKQLITAQFTSLLVGMIISGRHPLQNCHYNKHANNSHDSTYIKQATAKNRTNDIFGLRVIDGDRGLESILEKPTGFAQHVIAFLMVE